MQAYIVRIGNSKGIRIPAHILQECNIGDKVDMEVRDGKIVITAARKPRENWAEQFRMMRQNG